MKRREEEELAICPNGLEVRHHPGPACRHCGLKDGCSCPEDLPPPNPVCRACGLVVASEAHANGCPPGTRFW